MGQSFCCSRVSCDRDGQAVLSFLPSWVFSPGMERDSPTAGPPHTRLRHARGTAPRVGQFLVLLPCPQMAEGNNMAAINPKLLSEGMHGHFGQGLTSASCEQQGSSLGAAKQLDQKKADPSGANT